MRTCTNAIPSPRPSAGAGTISASSPPSNVALCSSRFPPVSDPLPLLHFNPLPVPPHPDRGLSRERESGRGSCPLWVAKRLPFERSNPLHHSSHNLLCSHITLWEWEPTSASSARLAPLLSLPSSLFIRVSLLYFVYDLPCLPLSSLTSKQVNFLL